MPVYYTLDVYLDNKFYCSKHCKFISIKQMIKVLCLWSSSNPKEWSYRNIKMSNSCDYSVDRHHQYDFTNLYLDFV